MEPCLALRSGAPSGILGALANLLQLCVLSGGSVTCHRFSCQTIPRVWVFLAILGKQFACLMTKDLPPIGGPKPLKTLLEFQVKCQEVVMQQNNSSPCGHQTRSQRNPLTKTVTLLATPRFQCGAGICAPQAKRKIYRKTGGGKHRERGFLYHQRITFSGSLVHSP